MISPVKQRVKQPVKQTVSALAVAAALSLPAVGVLMTTAPAAQAAPQAEGAKVPAGAYVLRVDGLACPYCAYGIEKQFHGLQGVTKTDVNLQQGVVVVHVKPGTHYSQKQLQSTVQDAGFTLKKIVSQPGGTS